MYLAVRIPSRTLEDKRLVYSQVCLEQGHWIIFNKDGNWLFQWSWFSKYQSRLCFAAQVDSKTCCYQGEKRKVQGPSWLYPVTGEKLPFVSTYRIFRKDTFDCITWRELHVYFTNIWQFGRRLSWMWILEAAEWTQLGRLGKVPLHCFSKWGAGIHGVPAEALSGDVQSQNYVPNGQILAFLFCFFHEYLAEVTWCVTEGMQKQTWECSHLGIKEIWKKCKTITILLTFPVEKHSYFYRNYNYVTCNGFFIGTLNKYFFNVRVNLVLSWQKLIKCNLQKQKLFRLPDNFQGPKDQECWELLC